MAKARYTLIWEKTQTPIVPYDENPESDDEGILVYSSQEAAECAARYQTEQYGDDESGPAVAVLMDIV